MNASSGNMFPIELVVSQIRFGTRIGPTLRGENSISKWILLTRFDPTSPYRRRAS